MGRKVHPAGFRIGVIRDWQAKWYADKYYADFLIEDLKLRDAIRSKYAEAGISQVEVDRTANKVSLTIHTARPGIVIGRGGQRVEEIRLYLESIIGKKVQLNILEIQQPELDAYLVARAIAEQIERRISYRRTMKQAIFRAIQAGAKGIRVNCSGRLGGVEIARRQTMHEGQVPLHTMRADIDYGLAEAHTTLGRIGVKVWIYKGEILPEYKVAEEAEAEEEAAETAASEGPEAETTTAAKEGEKAAKPAAGKTPEAEPSASGKRRRKTAKPAASEGSQAETSTTEKEEKDATTQAGEIPQES